MEAKSEFDKLMREAVAIKSAQLSQYRRQFDKWPQFHQAGLYYSESFASLHSEPLSSIKPVYTSKKEEGTSLFNNSEFQQALHKYEEALTLFRWVKNRNEKWRNSGIEDDDLTVEYYEQSEEVVSMMVSLYLNISLCNIKLNNWKEAVLACDEALHLEPNNVKALYRKSIALTLPAGSDLDDFKTAIGLLKKAIEIEPQNFTVRHKLKEFQSFLKEQRIKSKETFHSFFKKPTYEDALPETNNNKGGLQEYNDLINKGEEVIKDLISSGKQEEAKKLEKNIKLVKKYKNKAIKDARDKRMDFDNPTEEMKKNALEHGIDLDDPLVKAELKKLKSQKLAKTKNSESHSKTNEKSPVKTQEKSSILGSFKWLIFGALVLVTGIYFYSPTQTELW